MIKRKCILTACLVFLIPLFSSRNVYSISDGPSQPEAMQFEPVDATDLVNLATGDFTYNLPLMSVPGPTGSYPINLSYHAGIGTNQEATWVGLGWTLNPGAINRTVSGYPDDYNGDYVQTHFMVESKSGIGIGIGLGYGPVGLNMNYDSYTGRAGVNFYVGFKYGNHSFKAGLGTGGASASLGYGPLELGISASTQGGVGIRARLSNSLSVGYTLSSSGGGANYSLPGGAFSSMTESSGGKYYSSGVSLPIIPGILTLSFSEWQWTLDEQYWEKSYGYIYQNSYIGDRSDTKTKKYERQKQGEYLYTSQDLYQVHSQGLSGIFRPFVKRNFSLQDIYNEEEDRSITAVLDTDNPQREGENAVNDYVVFRFLGDTGANLITYDQPLPVGYRNIFNNRYGSKKIQPIFDEPNEEDLGLTGENGDEDYDGKIKGFEIVDVDGKVYVFSSPVNNYFQYSWNNDKENKSESYSLMATPYATNWLLTEIRGPDYVDRDHNGASDGDFGYWVKFHYTTDEKPHIWKSPFSGMGPSATSNAESASLGVRDMTFLDQIETASHIAVFKKSQRHDRSTADLHEQLCEPIDNYDIGIGSLLYNEDIIKLFKQSVFIHSKEEKIGQDYAITARVKTDRGPLIKDTVKTTNSVEFDFLGNWKQFINEIPDEDTYILKVTEKVGDYFPPIGNPTRPVRILGELSIKEKTRFIKKRDLIFPLLPPYNSNITRIEYRAETFGYDVLGSDYDEEILDIPANLLLDVKDAKLLVYNVFPQSRNVSKKLDQIDLYSKTDPGVSKNSEGKWVTANDAISIKSVEFNYNYSLCPGTPNSEAPPEDGSRDGKLTLSSVKFFGQNDTSGIPPYEFKYANDNSTGTGDNPRYNQNSWDNWGSYRAGNVIDGYKHVTSQIKSDADKADTWSLSKIITPTLGTIEIKYESDDYFHVSDFIDLNSLSNINFGTDGKVDEIEVLKSSEITTQDYLEINEEDTQDHNFAPNDYIAILLFRKSAGGSGIVTDTVHVTTRKIENVDYPETGSSMRNVKIKFDGPPYTFNHRDYEYDIKLYPRRVFGGGIRVKSITSKDAGSTYKTVYRYVDDKGFSSGITPTLPAFYKKFAIDTIKSERHSKPGIRVGFDIDDVEKYKQLFLGHEKSYGRPPPGVIYSQVEVSNVGKDDKEINGKTVYKFFTSKDHPYNVQTNPISMDITDKSGKNGKPKSVTYYEQINSSDHRAVKEDRYSYAFSSQLNSNSRVWPKTSEDMTDISTPYSLPDGSGPLGLTRESYSFLNAPTKDSPGIGKSVNRYYENLYLTESQSYNYFYESPQTTDNPEIQDYSSTANFIWDALSGQVIASASRTSDGKVLVTKTVPSYWRYEGMVEKNMLSQVGQETVFLGKLSGKFEDYVLNYNFPANDILSSTVTTWKDWGFDLQSHPDTIRGLWRINDTYNYNKQIDRINSAYSPFVGWNYSSDEYHRVDAGTPWQMTSNITRYNDIYSHPIEESHIDGTYTSAIYGYNDALPAAIVRNARLHEVEYYDFETQTGLGVTPETANNYFSDEGYGRTGQRSYKAYSRTDLSNEKYYTINKLEKGDKYRFSFWAKKGTANVTHDIEFNFTGPGIGVNPDLSVVKRLQTNDQWEFFEFIITPPDSGLIMMYIGLKNITDTTGEFHYIDDLRFHPIDAIMKTFAYDPINLQVTSMTDENNITTYYKYDDFGRLILVRDQDKNLLDKYIYHYWSDP